MDPMRRHRDDQRTPAELAIGQAMEAVEGAGAHPLLTDAVVLLGQARDRVADFVDGVAAQSPDDRLAILGGEEQIVKFFRYGHLPAKLQEVSKAFGELAEKILSLPRSAERTVALRKLLESKDAAVRAAL